MVKYYHYFFYCLKFESRDKTLTKANLISCNLVSQFMTDCKFKVTICLIKESSTRNYI